MCFSHSAKPPDAPAPPPPPPPPPTMADKSVATAVTDTQRRARAIAGPYQTILSGGQGLTQPANLGVKTLIGGG